MESIKTAEIISVGTELLLGDIINTDAAYLSRALAALGISVYRQSVVGDNRDRILAELDRALGQCDAVILTGGLGPTCDDITRECTAEYFGLKLMLDPAVEERIRGYLSDSGVKCITDNNLRQAYVPEGADVFMNSAGTAPGLAVHGTDGEGREKLCILLPGPPAECERMTDEHVIPYLARLGGVTLVSRNIYMYGIGESTAEAMLREFMDSKNPTVAPYCETGEVRIRVTASASDRESAEAACAGMVEKIKNTDAGKYIYAVLGEASADAGAASARVLVEKYKNSGLTVCFAESMTGGLAAKLVTDIPGASSVLRGSAVTYAVDSKTSVLGVSADTIEKYGVVSEECAGEMAAGARRLFGADVSVSVTGLAGPGGDGIHDSGHVCFGVASPSGVRTAAVDFGGLRKRQTVRMLAAVRAIHEAINETVNEAVNKTGK